MLFYNSCCLLISNALVCLILASLSQGAPVGPDGPLPPGFRNRGGLSPSDFIKASYYVKKIKQFTANRRGRSAGDLADSNIIYDVAYGPDLAKSVYQSIRDSQSQRRRKRKTIAFDSYVKKWITVYFKIDPDFTNPEKDTILTGFQKWDDNTIIDTSEVTWNYNMGTTPHLIITKDSGGGCWSYLGQQEVEQMLSLQDWCLVTLGSTTHELGHALGLLHEHQRPDRDDYIDVDYTHVPTGYESNWDIPYYLEMRMYNEVPFDYSSVMMYPATAWSSPPGNVIIEPYNTEYKQALAQRAWQSFYDEMAIDWYYALYANGTGCDGNTITCNRGGYPDPKHQCTQCKCSDGFGGTTCTVAAAGVGNCLPSNSGDLTVSSSSWSCLQSPSYGTANYPYGTLCNWHLTTVNPADEIEGQFQGYDFGTLCQDNSRKELCLHWVEVKYRNMHLRGPRFCCDVQNTTIITATGEMAVIFNAEYNYNVPSFAASLKKGFKFCYRLK